LNGPIFTASLDRMTMAPLDFGEMESVVWGLQRMRVASPEAEEELRKLIGYSQRTMPIAFTIDPSKKGSIREARVELNRPTNSFAMCG
jgi:hypothetical protein